MTPWNQIKVCRRNKPEVIISDASNLKERPKLEGKRQRETQKMIESNQSQQKLMLMEDPYHFVPKSNNEPITGGNRSCEDADPLR